MSNAAKRFMVTKKSDADVFVILFSYRNAFDKKRTIRHSVYHGLDYAKCAAARFQKNGYVLVDKKELL